MKKISKKFTIITILLMLIFVVSMVNAASAKIGITSSSKLKAGENVTVNISLGSVDVEEGLNGFIGTLEYDTEVFEVVGENDIEGANNWIIQGYNVNNGKFTLLRSENFTESGNIVTVTLKVKENLTATSAKVTVKDVQVTGGEETGDIDLGAATVTINSDATPSTPQQNQTTDNTANAANTSKGNTTSSLNVATNTSTTAKSDKTTTAKNSLPKTGINPVQIIAILVVIVISIVSYVLYKRNSIDVE